MRRAGTCSVKRAVFLSSHLDPRQAASYIRDVARKRRTVLSKSHAEGPSRRGFAIGAAAAIAVAALPLDTALAQDQAWEQAVKKILGEAKPSDGKMTIEMPEIAEHGNTVPFTISVDSPMRENDYGTASNII